MSGKSLSHAGFAVSAPLLFGLTLFSSPDFSHPVHLDLGLACTRCHAGAETSRHAGDQIFPRTRGLPFVPLGRQEPRYLDPARLNWSAPERIYRFDHAFHVRLGNLAPAPGISHRRGKLFRLSPYPAAIGKRRRLHRLPPGTRHQRGHASSRHVRLPGLPLGDRQPVQLQLLPPGGGEPAPGRPHSGVRRPPLHGQDPTGQGQLPALPWNQLRMPRLPLKPIPPNEFGAN